MKMSLLGNLFRLGLALMLVYSTSCVRVIGNMTNLTTEKNQEDENEKNENPVNENEEWVTTITGGTTFHLCETYTCADMCVETRKRRRRYVDRHCSCDELCLFAGDCCADFLQLCHNITNDSQATDVIRTLYDDVISKNMTGVITGESQDITINRTSGGNDGTGNVEKISKDDMFLVTAYLLGKYGMCTSSGRAAYTTIVSCPGDFEDNIVKAKCYEVNQSDFFTGHPHVSHLSYPQLTFRNKYCAACHGVAEEDTVTWNQQLSCEGLDSKNDVSALISVLKQGLCSVQFAPPEHAKPRPCFDRGVRLPNEKLAADVLLNKKLAADVLSAANFSFGGSNSVATQHGTVEPTNVTVSSKEQLVSLSTFSTLMMMKGRCNDDDVVLCAAYLYQVTDESVEYKNPHCMKCLTGYASSEVRQECPRAIGIDEPGSGSSGSIFSLFDLSGGLRGIKIDGVIVPFADLLCKDTEAFDHYTRTCRPVICAHGHVVSEGVCVPADTVISGDTQLLPNGSNKLFITLLLPEHITDCEREPLLHTLGSRLRFVAGELQESCTWHTNHSEKSFFLTAFDMDAFETVLDYLTSLYLTMDGLSTVVQNTKGENATCSSGYQSAVKENVTVEETENGTHAIVVKNGGRLFYPLTNIPFTLTLLCSHRPPRNCAEGGLSMRALTADASPENCSKSLEFCLRKSYTVTVCEASAQFDLNCSTAARYFLNETWISNGTLRVNGTDLFFRQDEFEIRDDAVLVCSKFQPVRDLLRGMNMFRFNHAQMYAAYALSAFSVLSLLAVLAAYLLLPELRTLPGKMTASLVTSLLAGHLLLYTDWMPARARHVACRIIAPLSHFSWLSVFAWMSAIAVHMARTFFAPTANQTTRYEADKAFRMYNVFCWGLPSVIVMTCVVYDAIPGSGYDAEYGKEHCGWIGPRTNIFAFMIPMGLSYVVNFGSIGAAVIGIERTARASRLASSRRSERHRLVIYAKMATALGSTWLLGLGVSFTDWDWLIWIYAVLTSLQGTFIAWAFVVNERFLRILKRKLGRHAASSSTPAPITAWTTASKPSESSNAI